MNGRFIHINGPVGYGKAIVISDFLKNKEIDPIWINLDLEDMTEDRGLTYLKVAVFRALHMDSEENNLQVKLASNGIHDILSLLFLCNKSKVIVLNNYHLLDEHEKTRRMIQNLIESAPPHFQFILVSCSSLHSDWAKLKSNWDYMELGTDELSFTPSEIVSYFQQLAGIELLPEELEIIYEKTEGWAAILPFILKAFREKSPRERMTYLSRLSVNVEIFSYFETAVMMSQGLEVGDFLLKSSVLTELDIQVMDQYIGDPPSETMLEALIRNNLFVKKENGALRYHSLFRVFLYETYKKKIGAMQLKQRHVELAGIYERRFEFFSAFSNYIAGGDYLNAARCANMLSSRYNPLELMILAEGWVEKASPGLSVAFLTFFIIRCYSANAYEELISHLEERMKEARASKSLRNRMVVGHRLAAIYTGVNPAKAVELYEDALEASTAMNDHPIAAFSLNGIADIRRCEGRLDEAMSYARKSLFIAEKYGIQPIQLLVLDTMANIYLDMNHIEEGALYANQALSLSDENDISNLFIWSTISRTYRMQQELSKSIEWARKAYALANAFSLNFDKGWALFELAQTLHACGDIEEAERSFAEACRWLESSSALIATFTHIWNEQTIRTDVPTRKVEQIQEQSAKLEVNVLGTFEMKWNGELIVINRSSSLRVLQYLITHRNRKMHKDLILDELFPMEDLKSASNHFHVALSTLRKSLEKNTSPGDGIKFICRESGLYYLNAAYIDLDLDHYVYALSSNAALPDIPALLRAESMYRGDYFSEYLYEPFLEIEREKIRLSYLKLLKEVAQHYKTNNDPIRALGYYEKLVNKDPYREESYIEYIGSLIQYGMRSQARHVASKMERYIHKELGLELPSEITAILLV
ncbi:BTAD domain-containing putative transcriptional regulator [Paenibacillus barcinonensis]|nr:BTAD domain-containing putative transcriptional regulator [Paenibacillus barcinonensis]